MAVVKPFKGIRPPKEFVEQVESRPYDVLESEEARAEAGDNEKSLYHIIKPEINFPVGTSEYDPRVYEEAARQFQKFQNNGWLVQDKDEHYYIYAQTMNGKTQYGLVIGAYVNDYMTGVIKKHELTRRDKEEDRMKHVRVNDVRTRLRSNLTPEERKGLRFAMVCRSRNCSPEELEQQLADAEKLLDARITNAAEFVRGSFGEGPETVALLTGLLSSYSTVMFSKPGGSLYRYNEEILVSARNRHSGGLR